MQRGRLLLHGDPAELHRILEALGLSAERAARPDGEERWFLGKRW